MTQALRRLSVTARDLPNLDATAPSPVAAVEPPTGPGPSQSATPPASGEEERQYPDGTSLLTICKVPYPYPYPYA